MARLVLGSKWQAARLAMYKVEDSFPGRNDIYHKDRMDLHKEKARKANDAASAIRDAMVAKLTDMRPGFAAKYDLDDQLVTLAIAQAAVGIAATTTSQATGMGTEKHMELEERLHAVVFDAMNDLLDDSETECNLD